MLLSKMLEAGIYPDYIYETRQGYIQVEVAMCSVSRIKRKLAAVGIYASGKTDHMDGAPYALVRFDPRQIEQSAMNDYMAIG